MEQKCLTISLQGASQCLPNECSFDVIEEMIDIRNNFLANERIFDSITCHTVLQGPN